MWYLFIVSFYWLKPCLFTRSKRHSIIGDIFGLLSAVCYGLFTGRNYDFVEEIPFYLTWVTLIRSKGQPCSSLILNLNLFFPQIQCYSRNLLDQMETELICRRFLDMLDSSPFLAFGGLVSDNLVNAFLIKISAVKGKLSQGNIG